MIRSWEKHEKPTFLPFLALFSKFTFLALTPEEVLFWKCSFYQNEPTIKLLLDTKNQNYSTTKTGEIFERLSGNVNSIPFENRISGLDFRGEGVKIVDIWYRAFRKYRLWSLWKSNRISVCSFRSLYIFAFKKRNRNSQFWGFQDVTRELNFSQTCGFHQNVPIFIL